MTHHAGRAAVLAFLVLLPVLITLPGSALPPGTSIAFSSSPTTEWNQPKGTAQGVTLTPDGILFVTTSSTLTYHTQAGGTGCSRTTTSDGTGGTNGAPTYHNGYVVVPRKTGNDATAASTIAQYTTGCVYVSQVSLGAGTIEAITHHRGHFYAAWRDDASGAGYLRQYTEDWTLVRSWFLANYQVGSSYTGPNGIAFMGDHILLPRHASGGTQYGVEIWRFPHVGGPVKVTTLSYPQWTNSALGRVEVASQGIHIVDSYEDGAASPYAWVVGREKATGNGGGNGGVARFGLTVSGGSWSWTTPPVAYSGSPLVMQDLDDQHPQGIAATNDNVFVLQSWEIEKWTHAGSFVSRRNVSADLQGLRLGGGTVEGDFLYIAGSNYPTVPRQSWILKYRVTDFALVDSQVTRDGYGEGGGVGYYAGSIIYLKDKGLSGEVWLQRYDPATLAFQSELYLGYYHEIYHQGVEVVSSGTTAYIIGPHHDPQDPYGKPGHHIWKSTNSGSSWTYQGAAAYTSWINTGDSGGRSEVNSQDIEYGCINTTPYVWSVGRRATDGAGYGAWVRHAVSDPSGYVSCTTSTPTADVSVSTSVYTATGATSGTEWSFSAAPGASNVHSTTYLRATNAGDAAGSVTVDLGASFTRSGGGSISTASNVVYLYGTASTPGGVSTWSTASGGSAASASIPVAADSTVWIRYRITALPAPLPDGSYTASLAVSSS